MPEEKNLCVRPSAVGPLRGGGLLKAPLALFRGRISEAPRTVAAPIGEDLDRPPAENAHGISRRSRARDSR